LLSSCITFHKADLLRFADRPVALSSIPLSPDQTIRTLEVSAGARQVLTYLVGMANPRGGLIAIGGPGNQAQPFRHRLAPRRRRARSRPHHLQLLRAGRIGAVGGAGA